MTTLLVDDSHPGIRILTLNRPERLNALDGPSLENLLATVRECSAPDRDIRVIVIRGSGRAFCAGADLKWLSSGVLADAAAHLHFQDRLQEMCETLEAADQVVIAEVHGFALAGGLELTLSCDLVVAAEDAQIGDEHIRRNLLPGGGGSQRLPRKIGLARGLFYLLTGRRMSGREAERLGLVSIATPTGALAETTLELARELAKTDGRALAAMKLLARRGLEVPLKEGLWMERWVQHRYRSESDAMDSGVAHFAAHGK
ncbi:enoyl-CoA hydratase/isomerase family protein [Paraburkholderia aspalathi]|uniref:Short chain enoyl-CoA hydratase n=1 Tax=Paraburkholderia aspalathi TaxID=1324617 RepID=A0A1I7DCF3_9BURK|nr:enoyl-CoA hydratase/isomerase family protein [Paraburkholderia aspalathi]SFU09276.1 short chain enoyl-CoA hydratase [Paraburkholderia aspalathi]